MDSPQNYWAIIPAAGTGRRMGNETPKQYLPINGIPILEHTVMRLAGHPAIAGVVVAIADNDLRWPALNLSFAGKRDAAPVYRARGGAERCHSVRNALETALNPEIGAREEDWVLVHDAVRPCLSHGDIDRLMAVLSGHPAGGLLGIRVRDTMKHADASGCVTRTVDREGLWHASTPQMFRLGELAAALTVCIERAIIVTDEAQAMELRAAESGGPMPRVVEGADENIKITRPGDLALAEFYLGETARRADS